MSFINEIFSIYSPSEKNDEIICDYKKKKATNQKINVKLQWNINTIKDENGNIITNMKKYFTFHEIFEKAMFNCNGKKIVIVSISPKYVKNEGLEIKVHIDRRETKCKKNEVVKKTFSISENIDSLVQTKVYFHKNEYFLKMMDAFCLYAPTEDELFTNVMQIEHINYSKKKLSPQIVLHKDGAFVELYIEKEKIFIDYLIQNKLFDKYDNSLRKFSHNNKLSNELVMIDSGIYKEFINFFNMKIFSKYGIIEPKSSLIYLDDKNLDVDTVAYLLQNKSKEFLVVEIELEFHIIYWEERNDQKSVKKILSKNYDDIATQIGEDELFNVDENDENSVNMSIIPNGIDFIGEVIQK